MNINDINDSVKLLCVVDNEDCKTLINKSLSKVNKDIEISSFFSSNIFSVNSICDIYIIDADLLGKISNISKSRKLSGIVNSIKTKNPDSSVLLLSENLTPQEVQTLIKKNVDQIIFKEEKEYYHLNQIINAVHENKKEMIKLSEKIHKLSRINSL